MSVELFAYVHTFAVSWLMTVIMSDLGQSVQRLSSVALHNNDLYVDRVHRLTVSRESCSATVKRGCSAKPQGEIIALHNYAYLFHSHFAD